MTWKIPFFLPLVGCVIVIMVAGCAGTSNSSAPISNETPEHQEAQISSTPYINFKGGTSVASFASMPAPVLGVVIDQDGKVVFVEPGSAAEQAGITPNDVLESVNDVPINPDREKVRMIISATTKDQVLNLKLKHADHEKTIGIKPAHPSPRTGMSTPTPVFSPLDYL